ncbi:MAG: glucose-6-phosphate isomerase family protein [Marvinbryantia sp.]|jgi:glucose-6-phosphate isomerase
MNSYNFDTSFQVDFDLKTGVSKTAESTKRYLSQMKNMFLDSEMVEDILKEEDPLMYEFYELGCPERAGDLAFGTSIIYPGKIGKEYYMTKGHFHTILNTAEVYWCLSGEGYMVMENVAGDSIEMQMKPGEALYVPRGYAHRTVNTGTEKLVVFWTFQGDAGHDYGTIETKGYHKLILEKDGKPTIVENPKWKDVSK